MSTFKRLSDSLGISQSISRLISNTQSGIDSIIEVYDALDLKINDLEDRLSSGSFSIPNIGYNGTSGVDGTSGTSGINGIDGTSGTSGINGVDGVDGTSGTSGVNGADGADGIDGTSGANGVDGVDGTSGTSGINGVDGVDGTSGTSGVNGADGADGIDGTSGVNGADGADGIDGTSGINGVDGVDGTSGTSGVNGADGIDGTSGTSGINGVDGVDGTSGTSGVNGADGADGTSGINGVDGVDGTSGTSGANGVDGVDGTSGTSGINGADGIDGTSGTSGINGADGIDGTSGINGVNGINGSSGTSGVNGANGATGPAGSYFIPVLSHTEIFRGQTHRNNSTTIDTYGGVVTSTSASNQAMSVGTASFAARQIRLRYYPSIIQTGRYTGVRGSSQQFWSVTGGFRYVCDFNISDTAYDANAQQFYGLGAYNVDLNYGGSSNTAVNTLTNIIGVGSDPGDANMQIFHNDGSGTASKIDLGSGFPANRTSGAASTTVYSIQFYNDPGSSSVLYELINQETGAVAQGTISSNLPSSSLLLNFFASRVTGSAGGVTNAGQFDLMRLGVYSLL